MVEKKFQPTLSAKVRKDKGKTPEERLKIYEKDIATITWPKLASIKYDGIRNWNPYGDGMLSRTMKRIPNRNMQAIFGIPKYKGADGEGIHGVPYQPIGEKLTVMQRATSAMMTMDGPADITQYFFDLYEPGNNDPYWKRLEALKERWGGEAAVVIVEQELVNSWEEAMAYFHRARLRRYEGLMLRDAEAPYFIGRPSLPMNILIKMKASDDCEGEIVDFIELKSNQNEQLLDERGYAKRSSHKENQVPMNTLGAFVCKNEELWPGQTFKIGTGIGLDHALRQHIWDNREHFIGRTITFKYDEMRSFEKPSIPSFRGFRDDL